LGSCSEEGELLVVEDGRNDLRREKFEFWGRILLVNHRLEEVFEPVIEWDGVIELDLRLNPILCDILVLGLELGDGSFQFF
jgi:hypothetical protein